MTEKELRRMNRAELIEIIAALKKRELKLQQRLDRAEQQLADRAVKIANAGSIAEAALAVNDVFEAAQAAADTWLQSIHAADAEIEKRKAAAQKECERILLAAEQQAREQIRAAEQQAKEQLQAAEQQCARMLALSGREAGNGVH